MSFTKVYVHFVWSTKYREPLLNTRALRKTVWQHMLENAGRKDIFIDTINGYHDHCHCLISLGRTRSMSETIQLIKGESSYWINQNGICNQKFEWQDHYYAVSVSESGLNQVRAYIKNQERHHATVTFEKEFETMFGSEREMP